MAGDAGDAGDTDENAGDTREIAGDTRDADDARDLAICTFFMSSVRMKATLV